MWQIKLCGVKKLPPPLLMVGTALLVLLFWLLAWDIAARLLGHPLFLPTPKNVFQTLWALMLSGKLWITAGASLLRIFEGFLFGVLTGIAAAVLFSFVKPLRTLFAPLFSVIRSTPVASFIMLLWLVFGNKSLPVMIGFLMVLPLIYQSLSTGIDALPKDLSEVLRLYAIPLKKRFTIFYYPSLMPYLAPALINSLGLCWKAGVAAEVLARTPFSIGKEISLAKSNIEIEELYAWTLTVIVLSLALEGLVKLLLKKWQRGEQKHA